MSIFDRADATLTYLSGVGSGTGDPGTVLQAAFAATIIAARDPAGTAAARALLDRFDGFADAIDAGALDAAIVCELARELKRCGWASREVTRLADETAAAVRGAPPDVRAQGRVRYLAASLAARGTLDDAHVAPRPPEVDAMLAAPHRLFDATNDQLTGLCDHLDADGGELDSAAAEILALIALGELRNYNIDAGCRIARTLARLHHHSAASADVVDFLRMQHRANGAYGFLNPLLDLAALKIDDPTTQFFLPLTVNVVRVIAAVHDAEREWALV